jgi:TRAP-type C4-dicarboxylate transport system permease small subunit
MERWRQRLHRVEDALLAALLLALVVLSAAQILARWLFETGWVYAEPLSRTMVVWLAMLGALAATRSAKHLSIDALPRLLPPAARRGAWAVTEAFAALICALLAWYGASLVAMERQDSVLLFGSVPTWWSMLVLPVGFALMGVRFIVSALSGPPRREPETPGP